MENKLQNTVARVLGSVDTDTLAGTAFLFADSDEQQLWMTCHHVIRELPSLKLAVSTNETLTLLDCEYCLELSSPTADVAVLKTRLDRDASSLLGLVVLPFGDPSASDDYFQWNLSGCGMQRKVGQHTRGVPFKGKFSAPHDGIHQPADDDTMVRKIQTLRNPWNIPFTARMTKLYEFCDESSRIEPGFSGSPICLAPRSDHEVPMCVGMLNARRVEDGSRYGFVIPYDVINAACPSTLPFHSFASCVVVVLAAKRDELETQYSDLSQEVMDRLSNYHPTSRDEWQPFRPSDPSIRILLEGLAGEVASLQLASNFLDLGDSAFRHYLGERHLGPLVYVIDPSSTNVDAIREVAMHASDHNRGAHYIYALCGTIGTPTRELLKDNVKEYLGGKFWEWPHSRRLEPAEDRYAFGNRVREGVSKAIEEFIREHPESVKRNNSPRPYPGW